MVGPLEASGVEEFSPKAAMAATSATTAFFPGSTALWEADCAAARSGTAGPPGDVPLGDAGAVGLVGVVTPGAPKSSTRLVV